MTRDAMELMCVTLENHKRKILVQSHTLDIDKEHFRKMVRLFCPTLILTPEKCGAS